MVKKSVFEHLNEIEDTELKEICLANFDEKVKDILVYTPGMAVMLSVNNQWDKPYWDNAYQKLIVQFSKNNQ